eukprot:GHUV01027970.1.p3 GENE.GHUV01027970.1~~GHUV01027970.1.p3  ORF type:complete len:118 (-),score=24.07 GHUV01027970.1:12-365(-)
MLWRCNIYSGCRQGDCNIANNTLSGVQSLRHGLDATLQAAALPEGNNRHSLTSHLAAVICSHLAAVIHDNRSTTRADAVHPLSVAVTAAAQPRPCMQHATRSLESSSKVLCRRLPLK